MNWYLAKVIFQVWCGDGTPTPQFEEQWRLIRADEVAWAHEKASVLGRLDENRFTNVKGENLFWKFIEVADIHRIGSLEDGSPLFSVTKAPVNAAFYIEEVRLKSQKAMAYERKCEIALSQPS